MMRQLLKFEFTCDGWHPTKGTVCPCDLAVEAYSVHGAEEQARQTGWHQDHRGWLCNAGGGHRGDRIAVPRTNPAGD